MPNMPFGVYLAVLVVGLVTLCALGAAISLFIERWRHMSTASQLARWRKLYKKEFGIELGDVVIPKRMRGFGRLIVIAAGVTLGQVFAALGRRFSVYSYYNDPDAEVTKNERTNTETYAIWVRERVEADKRLRNFSANDIKAAGLATQTLLEHLLHMLVVFDEDGTHLNVDNITLCSGSRDSDGRVLFVVGPAGGRRLHIDWCYPSYSCAILRARQVIAA